DDTANYISNLIKSITGKDWRQAMHQEDSESNREKMTELTKSLQSDGELLDGIYLTLKRRLLSYSSSEGPGWSKGEKPGSGRDKRISKLKRKRRESEDLVGDHGWEEITSSDTGSLYDDRPSDDDAIWQKTDNGHRIRHSGKKLAHRQFEKHSSASYPKAETENPLVSDNDKSGPFFGQLQRQYSDSPTVITKPVVDKETNDIRSAILNRAKNLTNVSIMRNVTQLKTPTDIIHEESTIALEIREALLLAVPLSLLMTVIILICVAFCCCRYRTHPLYSDHLSYPMREEEGEEYIADCPLANFGVCETCLPDFSSKMKGKKRQATDDQLELILEGGDTMEGEVEETDEVGLKSHPPLYALLSNLPPGGSHLEDDNRQRNVMSYYAFTSSSRPRRSQSLEFLTV
ncbi:hypothetical protein SK128_002787, partial [Halocaridina rubra]